MYMYQAANKMETTQYGYDWKRSTPFPLGPFPWLGNKGTWLGTRLEKDDNLLGPTVIKTHCLEQNSIKSP